MKDKKLSVLMFDAAFPPPIIGGKEKQAYLLSQELIRNGIDVMALSYVHNSNKTELIGKLSIERVKKDLLGFAYLPLFLLKMKAKHNILHIHTPSRIGVSLLIVGKLLGYKTVFKFPNENMLDNKNSISGKIWKLIVKKSDMLITLERSTYSKLLKENFIEKKIFNVSNGVEISKIKKNTKKKNIELIFLGRLVPQKKCDDLLKACEKLDENFKNWHLSIVGEGYLYDDLVSLSVELGIDKKVDFVGYQSNTMEWLKKSDIFVISSEREGMSNSMLEAMSIGLPIVTTKVSSTEEMLGKDYEFAVDIGDVDSLASKIFKLSSDINKRRDISKFIYDRCVEKFSIKSVAKKYIERYKEL